MDEESVVTKKKEITITGFGGQGIVLAGIIVRKAAALGDNKQSTLIQSYGPEARGGYCSAEVIISESAIFYPYVRQPDILTCMSQGGYDKFIDQLKDDGILLIDQDLVQPKGYSKEYYDVPATRIAEEMGRKMIANIIMVGFFTAITGEISMDAARNTVLESVPKGTEKMNIEAFTKGSDYGIALLKGRKKKALGKRGVQI